MVATIVAAVAVIGSVAVPQRAAGAILWTLTASPLSVVSGSTTSFALTATNPDLLGKIRCIVVTVPAIFDVESANAGGSWSASVNGNSVTVTSATGIGGLPLSTTFSVRARALGPGQLAWSSVAWSDEACSKSRSLLGVPPIVAVLGPAVTPTPAPTPPPTPTPTLPLPSLPLPTLRPLPTLFPTATPRPTAPTDPTDPTPRPSDGGGGIDPEDPTGRPTGPSDPLGTPAPDGSGGPGAPASAAPDPGEPGSAPGAPASGGGGGPDGSGGNQIEFDTGRVEVGGAALGVLAGFDTWIVPAASFAGPGILILIWIAVQSIGAAAWVPVVRRFRGAEEASA